MDPSLFADSQWPEFPDLDEGNLALVETMSVVKDVVQLLFHFRVTQFTDADGNSYEALLRPLGRVDVAIPDAALWGLTVIDDGGAVTVAIDNPGTIRKTSALDSGLTILKIDTYFVPAANHWLFIKVDLDGSNLRATLDCGEIPTFPEIFEVEEDENFMPKFVAHYYPLWRFYDAADALSSGISGLSVGTLTAVKYAENAHFQTYNVRWENPDGLATTVVQLLSGYRGGLS